jgi:hypothetical protein
MLKLPKKFFLDTLVNIGKNDKMQICELQRELEQANELLRQLKRRIVDLETVTALCAECSEVVPAKILTFNATADRLGEYYRGKGICGACLEKRYEEAYKEIVRE